MDHAAALLVGWSVFEPAARALLPAELLHPQPSGRLAETLAAKDHVILDGADALRRLGRMRNEAAHGRFDLVPSQDDVTLRSP